jgi:hypothetical protein
MTLTTNYVEKLQKHQLSELAKFVVLENFKHHTKDNIPLDIQDDVYSIYDEELKYYKNSQIFSTKDYSGAILGSIRILEWDFVSKLPLEKIFGINPLLTLNNSKVNKIYHIGRFAVKKGNRDIMLFKRLLINVAKIICSNKDNVAFAECDRKLLRILNLLGVKTQIIGRPIVYLGSETIPIQLSYEGVIGFYNKNKNLLQEEREIYSLPQSVVSQSMSFTTL